MGKSGLAHEPAASLKAVLEVPHGRLHDRKSTLNLNKTCGWAVELFTGRLLASPGGLAPVLFARILLQDEVAK